LELLTHIGLCLLSHHLQSSKRAGSCSAVGAFAQDLLGLVHRYVSMDLPIPIGFFLVSRL